MKKTRFFFSALLLMVCGMVAHAQLLTHDVKITKNLSTLAVDGNSIKVDPSKSTATLEAWIFNDGHKTYTIKVAGEICDQLKVSNPFQFSWSGDENSINIGNVGKNGKDIYVVMNTNRQMDGIFAPEGDNVTVGAMGKISRYSEFINGMTLEELKKVINTAAGMMLTLKKGNMVGGLQVYTAYTFSAKNRKNTNITDFKKDKPMGYFYFDVQGKLAKWYLTF